MTSFFDDAQHQINVLNVEKRPEQEFLDHVKTVEKEALILVLLNSGDREFPSDLREKILGIIALHSPTGYPRNADAERRVLAQRYSPCIEGLHSAFHELARLRLKTRFGTWTDSPKQNLVSRDEYDREHYTSKTS